MPTSPTPQRAAERVSVEAFVIVIGDRGEEWVFRTRDISEHGLFLFTKVARTYPFKVGQTLRLELHDYDEALHCRAVVARIVEPGSPEASTYPTGFGVRIVDADGVTRDRLRALIASARTGTTPY
ncbi:MAG: PilZ domain-containing protein [Kofleriaceae bacterium]|jgi:hypothetical protein|nr:PilZ domain-containing protein [Kofleriaceae bacterium]MBP6838223.1 PilZ domain-containing protein [Kofleriaceae bacterium]MBP9204116.1 PilZ domain-containing protein [Kofleriaceae bacterium]